MPAAAPAPPAPPEPGASPAPLTASAPRALPAASGGADGGADDDPGAPDAAAREAALLPDWAARRDLQLRLRLAGEAPGALDGVLGPRTRAALSAWQAARGHHVSGRVNAATLAALRAETAAEAAAWRARERERLRARNASAPTRRPARESAETGCARNADGVVITGRSVRCDIVYLREDLSALFR
ncbi:MAG: peptidoglycan-binding domain-containing protein [Pseudomonadota bacterium]